MGYAEGMVIIILAYFSQVLGCSTKCWYAFNSRDSSSIGGYEIGGNFTVTTEKAFTGIITVQGSFDRDRIRDESRTSMSDDYFAFIATNNVDTNTYVEPLRFIIRIHADDDNGVMVVGVNKTAGSEPKLVGKTEWLNHPENALTIFKNIDIHVQISDLTIERDGNYTFFIGKPGEARKVMYNYGSSDIWRRYENYRLNATNMLTVNRDDVRHLFVRMVKFDSIIVCQDPLPVLCGNVSVKVIEADIGETYILSCAASGAPYLESKWEDKLGAAFHPDNYTETRTISTDSADSILTSTLAISKFTLDHVGTYTCTIQNKNFKNRVQKTFILRYNYQVAVISSPCKQVVIEDKSSPQLQTWIIEGWPLDDIQLNCSGIVLTDHVERQVFPDYYPPRVRLALDLTDTAQNVTNCGIYNVKTAEALNHVNFSRISRNDLLTNQTTTQCEPCPSKPLEKSSRWPWWANIIIALTLVGGILLGLVLSWVVKNRSCAPPRSNDKLNDTTTGLMLNATQ